MSTLWFSPKYYPKHSTNNLFVMFPKWISNIRLFVVESELTAVCLIAGLLAVLDAVTLNGGVGADVRPLFVVIRLVVFIFVAMFSLATVLIIGGMWLGSVTHYPHKWESGKENNQGKGLRYKVSINGESCRYLQARWPVQWETTETAHLPIHPNICHAVHKTPAFLEELKEQEQISNPTKLMSHIWDQKCVALP